jgi:23S rRNA (cytosine1962-C5)-methyltransferase
MSQKYQLLDTGNQRKVEMFGEYKIIRPCPQALWKPFNESLWEGADTEFRREALEKGKWYPQKIAEGQKRKNAGMGIPSSWYIESNDGLEWLIEPNEFGNLGVFTEHWSYQDRLIELLKPKSNILNLFTYSGSNCVNLVKRGFRVTAVDSSKSAMDTYVHNLGQNKLSREGQKLVLEDAYKFIAREERRGSKYDGVMIDAPSFGRGTKGEVFKIEDDLVNLITTSFKLLESKGVMFLTLHSPRFTPASLEILCSQLCPNKIVEVSEIVQDCQSGSRLPSGFLVIVR